MLRKNPETKLPPLPGQEAYESLSQIKFNFNLKEEEEMRKRKKKKSEVSPKLAEEKK